MYTSNLSINIWYSLDNYDIDKKCFFWLRTILMLHLKDESYIYKPMKLKVLLSIALKDSE